MYVCMCIHGCEGTKDGYSGYGAEQGMGPLREKIASVLYNNKIAADEVRTHKRRETRERGTQITDTKNIHKMVSLK